MNTSIRLTSTLFCLFLWPAAASAQPSILEGAWYNAEKTGKMQFYMRSDKLYGKVIWFKDSSRKDVNNPDTKLRSRQIIGSEVLSGFVSRDGKTWTDGKIYDPESGKTYASKMTMVSATQLDVRGYIGTPLLGRTTRLTRAD